jgi:hypothetical protein
MSVLPRVAMAVSRTRGCFSLGKGRDACRGVPPGEVGTDMSVVELLLPSQKKEKGVAGADSSEGGGGEDTICPAVPAAVSADEDGSEAGDGVGES